MHINSTIWINLKDLHHQQINDTIENPAHQPIDTKNP